MDDCTDLMWILCTMQVRIADKMYATKNRIIKKNVLSGVNSNKHTYGVNQLNFDLSSQWPEFVDMYESIYKLALKVNFRFDVVNCVTYCF